LADDLLFARAVGSGRIFFICAACAAAGTDKPTAAAPSRDQSIIERVEVLAPSGWTLALVDEAERCYPGQVKKAAAADYEELVTGFPGFCFRS
jgi:hypothetical protein